MANKEVFEGVSLEKEPNEEGGNKMSEAAVVYSTGNDMPVFADDMLLSIARQAEARIDAVIKIKQIALKVTNPADWTDQQGRPYLQASGSEKIANLFNISWRIDEPTMEEETDGTITYIYKGTFTLAGRSIEIEGSRSSRDTFFKKYDYDQNGKRIGEKPLDRRDLKMAAMTNLLGNGITRILGIRNLTWEDLSLFAGISQDNVKGKVAYKKDGKTTSKAATVKADSNKETKQETTSADPKKSPAETLKDELATYCDGNLSAMSELLKELTVFKGGEDGKEIFMSLQDIHRAKDTWVGKTLSKLRDLAKQKQAPVDDDWCCGNKEACQLITFRGGIPWCEHEDKECTK